MTQPNRGKLHFRCPNALFLTFYIYETIIEFKLMHTKKGGVVNMDATDLLRNIVMKVLRGQEKCHPDRLADLIKSCREMGCDDLVARLAKVKEYENVSGKKMTEIEIIRREKINKLRERGSSEARYNGKKIIPYIFKGGMILVRYEESDDKAFWVDSKNIEIIGQGGN